MSDQKYIIDFQPKEAQIAQINIWMIEENKKRTGLVHDLSILSYHAEKNTFATITTANETIGFVTWDTFKRGGHISVAAVAAEHRRSGVGCYLIETLFAYLLEKGILALYLECAPATSEKFWRKLGFKKMPPIDGYFNGDTPRLYKCLLPTQETGVSNGSYIQVYEWGNAKKMRWPLHYKPNTNELLQPIIQPVSGDWCIEHIISEIPKQSEKIKNFRSGSYLDDPFLIITAL
ncbi:N-acetyltransferase [Mucilaginibacter sp.]|uniref:GNAT family N-acetyltransferase n=1 Tax=Mucilaginibacter sp. TaxID=1882438 RepID=UPI0026095194|nr:GNAT family N-acetyltransferase [Mucilaginibacter sp.]MDB4918720.1 hypothetical protein [Mucilaginibacter sp.]